MSSLDFDETDSLSQGSATIPLTTLQNLNDKLLFVMDRFTNDQIQKDPTLNLSMIRHTHLNRLTNITRLEARIKTLETKRDYAILEIFTNEEEYDEGAWFKLNSLTRNEELSIHDSIDGWKMKQLQEKSRRLNITEEPPPKKGFFSRFA
jgi:hypothetical protein